MSGPPEPSSRTTATSLAGPLLAPSTTAPAATTSSTVPVRTSASTAPAPTGTPSARGTTGTPSPAALRPAAPGTYRYDTSGQSRYPTGTAPFPAVTTLVVDPPVGTTQHATRDLRDPARNGPVFESTLDYRPDGIYLGRLSVTTTVLVFGVTEELRPPEPVLLLATGAAPGYHRELDVATTQAGDAHLVLDVLRTETVTVAGQSVDTSVVRLSATLAGATTGRLDLTVWLSSAHRLWVKERFVADASAAGGIGYHGEYEATIQRLAPS